MLNQPTSSPMITRMLGLRSGAWARTGPVVITVAAATMALSSIPAASVPPARDNREPTATLDRRFLVDLVPDILCFLPIRCVDVFLLRSARPLCTRRPRGLDPSFL